MNNPKILPRVCILGGGGYLGQYLAQNLQENGYFVVILDLSFPSFPYIPLDPTRVRRIEVRDFLLLLVQSSFLCFKRKKVE